MNPTAVNGETSTILIVDDAKINRELLRLQLAKYGHRFLTATNGNDAMEVLAAHPEVDLILLDLMMPGMDGFDFLTWRSGHPEAQAVPVIINSSLDDFDSIARALTMGAYDYFTKPLAQNDLEIVLPLKIRNAIDARRLVIKTRRQNDIMRRELEMAARYQKFLLPGQVQVHGAKVVHLFQPCQGVGGDYFDYLELPGGRLGMVVADVAGHGVASAMTASIVKALWPGFLTRSGSPAQAFRDLNDDLIRLTQEDGFVTAFGALYDPQERRLSWSLAGHPSPFFLPMDGPAQPLDMQSVFLGVFASDHPLVQFEDQGQSVRTGDRLVLYTDGLTEAPGAQGGMYGKDRLVQVLEGHRHQELSALRQTIWKDLNDYVQGEFPDDVAFILVEF